MKTILLWETPQARPRRLTVADAVASALVRSGVAAAADPAEAGALSVGGPLSGDMPTVIALEHGLPGLTRITRYVVPLAAATIAISAGVAAAVGQLPGIPLPTLPLANGAKVLAFGDSYIQYGLAIAEASSPTPGIVATVASVIRAAWGSNPVFRADSFYDPADPLNRADPQGHATPGGWNGSNQGLGGDHLVNDADPSANGLYGGGMLARLSYALARLSPGDILYWDTPGTNTIATGDPGQGSSASSAYVISQIQIGLIMIRAARVWAVVNTIGPRSDFDAAKNVKRNAVNAWLRAQAAANREGFRLVDADAQFVSSGDAPKQSLYYKETIFGVDMWVHKNGSGAKVQGDALAAVLATMIAPGSVFNQDPSVANLFLPATYYLPGNTGTRTGSSTGQAAPGTYSGLTVVASGVAAGCTAQMTRGNGFSTQVVGKTGVAAGVANKQVFVVTPVVQAGTPWHQSMFRLPDLALDKDVHLPTNWYRLFLFVDTPDQYGPVNIEVQMIAKKAGGGEGLRLLHSKSNQSTAYSVSGAPAGLGRGGHWLPTEPFQLPADGDYNLMELRCFANFACDSPEWATQPTFTMAFSKPMLRGVTDPRPAWNL